MFLGEARPDGILRGIQYASLVFLALAASPACADRPASQDIGGDDTGSLSDHRASGPDLTVDGPDSGTVPDLPLEREVASGPCLPEEQWCPVGPWKFVDTFSDVLAFADDDVWVVGRYGRILHWNGEELEVVRDTWPKGWLSGIWSAGPDDVWFAGTEGKVIRRKGSDWTEYATGTDAWLWGIHGTGTDDVWVVGIQSSAAHWDGSAWTVYDVDGDPDPLHSVHLEAVWCASSEDVWAVGLASNLPVIYRWNGGEWTRPELPVLEHMVGGLSDVWGTGPDDVWMAGPADLGAGPDGWEKWATVLHWDGKELTEVELDSEAFHPHVTGTAPGDVWLSGPEEVAHLHDGQWDFFSPGMPAGALSVSPSGTAWIAGDAGALLRCEGQSCDVVSPPVPDLADVRGTGDALWAVGTYGSVIKLADGQWQREDSGTLQHLHGMWVDPSGEPWAVGENGTTLRRKDGAWLPLESGTDLHLLGIWGSSDDDVWAVGGTNVNSHLRSEPGEGIVLHWDGEAWTPDDATPAGTLRAVAGAGPDDVWAVGSQQTALHWDGAVWTPMALPAPYDFYGLVLRTAFVDGAGRVWVAGRVTPQASEYWTGLIGFSSGEDWTWYKTGLTNDVAGIWSDGADLAIAAGEGLEVFTWLGGAWHKQDVWIDCLDAVWGDGQGNAWVVGKKGGVLQRTFQ